MKDGEATKKKDGATKKKKKNVRAKKKKKIDGKTKLQRKVNYFRNIFFAPPFVFFLGGGLFRHFFSFFRSSIILLSKTNIFLCCNFFKTPRLQFIFPSN